VWVNSPCCAIFDPRNQRGLRRRAKLERTPHSDKLCFLAAIPRRSAFTIHSGEMTLSVLPNPQTKQSSSSEDKSYPTIISGSGQTPLIGFHHSSNLDGSSRLPPVFLQSAPKFAKCLSHVLHLSP
jgi:hypothetical protein